MPAQSRLLVELKKLHPKAHIPAYQTPGAAGFDIHARLDEELFIAPGETAKISTGIAVSINDPAWALYLMSRSGLASKGIMLGNGIGLIDSDYQGELGVLLFNGSRLHFPVRHGDRICQGVFAPVIQALFQEVPEFTEKTERGARGFGSTGTGA